VFRATDISRWIAPIPAGGGEPRLISARVPSENTQSIARTHRRVAPKCIECAPAALVDVIPPIVQNAPLDGSTGKAEPMTSRGAIDVGTDGAGPDANRPSRHVPPHRSRSIG
jgi:hypothetical protein